MGTLPDNTGLREAAERYWRMGLPIIPLNGKVPALKDPFGFVLNESSVRFWFGERACNIGLVTGDYAVIDSDTDEAEQWIKEKKITSPMVVRSGGGGLHRYFDGRGLHVRNWQRLFGINGLDGRGHGGFIVFPPSIHPNGNRYEFLTELLPVEELPPFRMEWIKPERKKLLAFDDWAKPRPGHRDINDVRRSVRRTFAISGNGGHPATYAVACELVEAGLGFDDVLAELTAWNEICAFPPWSQRELIHKVRSVFQNKMRAKPANGSRSV